MAGKALKSSTKQTSAKKRKANNFLKAKFDLSSAYSVPDLGGYYQHELQQRLNEITSHTGGISSSARHLYRKMRTTTKISGKDGEHARKNAYEIANLQNPQTTIIKKLVQELEHNPLKHSNRLIIASNILKLTANLTLDNLRKIMMQVYIPLALGEFNSENIKLMITVYRMYLKELVSTYKKEAERINDTLKTKSTAADRNSESNRLHKVNVMAKLMIIFTESGNAIPSSLTSIRSVNTKQIQRAIDNKIELSEGVSLDDAKKNIETNLTLIVSALIEVKFSHKQLFQITETLKKLNPTSPVPDFLQAKIWMDRLHMVATQFALTGQGKPLIKDRLKRTLESYGLSQRYFSAKGQLSPLERQILIGHASAVIYAYNIRINAEIPRPVVEKLLRTGRRSLYRSKLPKLEDKTGIYNRYQSALYNLGIE